MPPIYYGSAPFALKRGSQALNLYYGSTLISGGSNPLRGVSSSNRLAEGGIATSGVVLGAAMKDLHHIGSGDITELRVALNNWGLNGFVNANSVSIPEMWITVSGNGSGYAVKWGGATSTTLLAGAVDYQSDIITPENLGFTGVIPRGTALYVGYRAEVSTAGHMLPGTSGDRNPTTNSSIVYQPGVTVISNLQGSSAMAWAGGTVSATGDACRPPAMLVGKFSGGDKASFIGIGDSIVEGSGAGSDGMGFFYRALFLDYAAKSSPLAGLQVARAGSNTSQWTDNTTFPGQPARLAEISKYFNVAVERYGINSLGSGAATIIAQRKQIWATIRSANAGLSGGRAVKIMAIALTPYTTSSDAWATYANQTPNANAGGVGGTLDQIEDGLLAIVGAADGPTAYVDNTAGVRGAGADFWKWSAGSTADGLHPTTAGYTSLADSLRPTLFAEI